MQRGNVVERFCPERCVHRAVLPRMTFPDFARRDISQRLTASREQRWNDLVEIGGERGCRH
jgi:hypothetical protein